MRLVKKIDAVLRRLGTMDRRGIAALEAALVMPVLALVAVGTIGVGQQIWEHQRLNTVTARVGDLITQEADLTAAKMSEVFAAVEHLTGSGSMGNNGVVVVSAVEGQNQGAPKILWQERGAGELDEPSRIGVPGGPADLPNDFALAAGETVVVVEVIHRESSLYQLVAPGSIVTKTSMHRGRMGDLREVAAACKNGNSGQGNNGNCGNTSNNGNTGKK